MFAREHAEDEDTLATAWRRLAREKRKATAPLLAEALAFIEDLAADVALRIRSLGSERDLDDVAVLSSGDVFDVPFWIAEIVRRFDPLLAEVLRQGFLAGSLNVSYEGSFNEDAPEVLQALSRLSARSRIVPESLRGVVEQQILTGLEAEETYEEIASRVELYMEGIKEATRIARTTGGGAFEAGQDVAFKDAGITKTRWLSSRGPNASEGHLEADGQERAIGEPFMVRRQLSHSFEMMMHPLDSQASASNIVNCECTRLPVLED